MFDCCLVSSLSPMVFYNILLPMFSAGRSPASLLLVCVPPRPTAAWLLLRSVVPYHSLFLLLLLRPSRQVRLLFLSTSLLSLGYPSSTPPSLFLTGYFNAQVSGFRYPSPAPPRLFLTGYFDAQVSAFRYPSPAPPRLLLTGYLEAQVSGFRCPSPAPPRLFLAGYLDAQVSVFRCPSPAPPRLFLTGYFDAQVSLFPVPQGLLFAPCFGVLDRLFRRPPFFPPNLPFPVTWVAGSLFVPPCGTPAVFTAPWFLPLRGFYRSAVFTAPLSPVFWGLCSSAALMLAAPQSSPTSGRLALCAALRFACDFYRSGFYRSAVFTALRFLPLRGFYRSAVFTAPRFLPLRFRRFFWGLCSSAALMLAAPQSSPTSGRLALCAALRFACDFYRSVRFFFFGGSALPPPSPLRGFLCRLAVRLRPFRGFYRSAFAGFLGGSALPPPSCLLPPSLHPLPGGSLFVPPCGTPAIFTAPLFLPLRGFYRSAFASFLGALLFRRPHACCSPVFALFRAHPVVSARP